MRAIVTRSAQYCDHLAVVHSGLYPAGMTTPKDIPLGNDDKREAWVVAFERGRKTFVEAVVFDNDAESDEQFKCKLYEKGRLPREMTDSLKKALNISDAQAQEFAKALRSL